MPKTSTEINLKLYDLTAGQDAEYTSTDKQPFIDINDLNDDFDAPFNYATLEPDQWRLDGTMDLFPDTMSSLQYGLWSLSRSDSLLDINVPLEINFDTTHSSIGLSFEFYPGEFATGIDVSWYDSSDVLIVSRSFANNKTVFFADESVLDYKRISITFTSLNKEGHYLKLYKIGFGVSIVFDDEDIQTASIIEELNPVSDELSINTMTAKVITKDADFIERIYETLQDQQQLVVTELVDSVRYDMGTFYLTTRENPNENTIIFNTQDLVGLLASEVYVGGMFDDTFENVVGDIMSSFGTTLYEIDDSLKTLNVVGYIPITDHRRALQIVSFAVNAVVDCSRSNKVNIYPLPTTSPSPLSKDEFFIGSVQKELEKVTDVLLNLKSYEVDTGTTKEAYKVTHVSGTYTAQFSEPFTGLAITGGTITQSGVNYAQFSTTGGVVTITGTPYISSTQSFLLSKSGLPATTTRKQLAFENTLIWNGTDNVQNLFDKLIDNNERDVTIVLGDESAGDFLSIDALYGNTIEGYVESATVDLTGGFVGNLKIIGKVIES